MGKKVRNYREEVYKPLESKNVKTILVQKLKKDYGFNHNGKVASVLIDDILATLAKYSVPASTVKPGQMLWMAIAEDEFGGGKPMAEHKMVPVVLTLTNDDDVNLLCSGAKWKQIRRNRVARIIKEAKEQKGVLAQNDVAAILGAMTRQIQMDIKSYTAETGEILPYRGWVHDTGATVTHKPIIVKYYLEGYLTNAISKMTYHTAASVDRYIKGFERVRMLHDKFSSEQIAVITDMSLGLVKQYQTLIKEYLEEKLPDTLKTSAS